MGENDEQLDSEGGDSIVDNYVTDFEESRGNQTDQSGAQAKKKEGWLAFFRPKTMKGRFKLWLVGLAVPACLTMIGYILTIGLITIIFFYVENLFESDNTDVPAQQAASAPADSK